MAVEKEFSSLVSEYGFSPLQETYSPEIMGNSSITYLSDKTILIIVLDRGQVLMKIGESTKPRKDWFELTDVVRFFAADETMDVYQLSTKNPYDTIPIEEQVSRLAMLTRNYCVPFLKGDFSMKKKIKDLEKRRSDKLLNKTKK